jgi:hypothetical protein
MSTEPQGKYVPLEDAHEVIDQMIQDLADQIDNALYREMRENGRQRCITLLENGVELGLVDPSVEAEYRPRYEKAVTLEQIDRIGAELGQEYVPALVPRTFEIVDLDRPEDLPDVDIPNSSLPEADTAAADHVTRDGEAVSLDQALDDDPLDGVDVELDWSDYEFPVIVRDDELKAAN